MLTDNLARSYSIHAAIKETQSRPAPKQKVSRLRRFIATTVLAGVTFSGAAVAASPAAFATPPAATSAATYTQAESDFIAALAADHDAERASRALTPFHRDSRLDESAQLWANEMVANSNAGAGDAAMVHSNTAGTSSPLYFANAIPGGWSQAAENICRQGSTTDTGTQRGHTTFTAFMNSAPHRATILTDRYESIGFAVATDNRGTMFCSVNFGDYYSGGYVANPTPAPSTPSTPAPSPSTPTTPSAPAPSVAPPASTTPPVSFGGGSGGGVAAPEIGTSSPSKTVTVAGNSRYGTAVSIAQTTNAAPEMVVIASGDQNRLIDSLSAAPFAKSVNAPLLVTTGNGLSQEVRDYIAATPSIRGAVIVGGEQAVSEQVMTDLNSLGLVTARLNGANRYSTSAMLASKTLANTGKKQVFITTGTGSLADAVSASGTASALGAAVLIVPNFTENLDGWSRSFVEGKTVVAVGGTDVLPTDVASAMGAVERIFGASRYDTSLAVADYAVSHGVKAETVFVSNGSENRLVDALAAGSVGSISLLVQPEGFSADVTKWFSANKTTEVITVGGMTPTR